MRPLGSRFGQPAGHVGREIVVLIELLIGLALLQGQLKSFESFS